MAHSSSDLSSLLQNGSTPNQRISFSVRVRNASLPQSSDNIGLPWIHVDLLPGGPLSETMDYRYRPYSVSNGPAWRHKSNLWLEAEFERHTGTPEAVVDSFEDVYFPVDIPSIACIDLIGCLFVVNSITAGHAPTAQHAIVNAQADEELCGEDDHLHKKVPKFTQWEPLWSIKVAGKFESLSANSDSKFSKIQLIPPKMATTERGAKNSKPINVLRFEMSSARKSNCEIGNNATTATSTTTTTTTTTGGGGQMMSIISGSPAPKRSRLRLKPAAAAENRNQSSKSSPPPAILSRKSSTSASKNSGENYRKSNSSLGISLDQLPPELIFQIVGSIPGGAFGRLRVLTSLSGVNRRLRAVCSDPALFSCLDLKPAHLRAQRLSPQFVAFLAQRTKLTRSLRLSWLPFLATATQSRAALKVDRLIGPELTSLVAQSCPLVDDDFLRSLSRSCARCLQTLDLSSCWAISRRGFGCLDALASLRRLSLSHTLISQKTLEILLQALGQRLEVLNLSSLHDIANMDAVCGKLADSAPNLLALDLSDSPSLTGNGLTRLAKGCPRLEELVLMQCGIMASIASSQVAALNWHNLRRLSIHVTDVGALEMLAQENANLPKLEQLAVSCFRRSGAPISVLGLLLGAFPNLFFLKLPVEWPSAADFEESRRSILFLRQRYPKCAIQTQ